MESLQASEIKAVPGLFVSDRFAARSISILKSHNITHVLSITRPEDTPKYAPDQGITHCCIDIDDDPLADILFHLQSACDWIQVALEEAEDENTSSEKGTESSRTRPGVLVHCTQGISRSGALCVAYLMRSLRLPYSEALSLARESRPLITPNIGFEKQLRIWGFCEYEVVVPGSGSLTSASGNVVTDVEKRPYVVWKKERDELFGKGEVAVNRERAKGLAGMAAEFGRRRREGRGKGGGDRKIGEGEKEGDKNGWERVEAMEKEWNRKMINGEVGGESKEDASL
ncbi:phosphatases II [Mytilinidion resinicola]|uniref:protein-tyrosine-phosphatase n=1 Tax=Mytilinidion resinicola TaxID=574789 RepID=A0A6A6Z559_9PEZI|nr:phosphatases II [Mytilinidion resinicola]KAF2816262.1 phosphatases II [Mytilinidion resinicola]